jgi:hypothetical protein
MCHPPDGYCRQPSAAIGAVPFLWRTIMGQSVLLRGFRISLSAERYVCLGMRLR